MNSPVIPTTPPKSVPGNSEVAPMEEYAAPTSHLNPSSVKSAKSPAVPPPPTSLNESQVEHRKMTTQGPPPAGVETEEQAKMLVAEAISGGYDPSLYNEASPVPTLSGQHQTPYRNMTDSPMSMARPSPMDPGIMYHSPGNPVWDNNISMHTKNPIHHGHLNKGNSSHWTIFV